MRIMSPSSGTTKPAPAASTRLRTVTSNPCGRPASLGLSESEDWVLATQRGRFS